jgi:glyoxylase-like metal-dependent hydrolase (beta-lactamase superfamily II)
MGLPNGWHGLAASAALLWSACSPVAAAEPAIPLSLIRLDCGTIAEGDLSGYSDTHAMDGKRAELPVSCYLIKHGETYLLWDAGLDPDLKFPGPIGFSVKRTLISQLAELGITPDQITYVAVSHYHLDHVGQAASFPKATLLMNERDWAVAQVGTPLSYKPGLARWIAKTSKVETFPKDKDVFGDGSVVILDMPGHTEGHSCLLVNLAGMGPVMLTGDLAHQRAIYDINAVPQFNVDRADTLASLDRFKAMAANLKATVIIGHEAGDIGKLPAFPKAAQ